MARVTGPLFSFTASGQVGGAVVFSRWKGRPYLRKLSIPANPKSGKQVSVRAVMAFLAQQWSLLTPVSQATWESLAEAKNVSPFNSYIGWNQTRHVQLLALSTEYPPAGVSTPASAPTLVATGGSRMLTLELTQGVDAPDWGYSIYRKLGSQPAGNFDELAALVPFSGSPQDFLDSPLAPGVWYYKAKGFNADGVPGALSAEAHATVT